MSNCRICYDTINTPLEYYCKCRGSLAPVHKKCLIKWIKQDQNKNETCEICKEKYKINILYNKFTYYSYIILSFLIYIVFLGVSLFLIHYKIYLSFVSVVLTLISLVIYSKLYYCFYKNYITKIKYYSDIDIIGISVNIYEDNDINNSSTSSLSSTTIKCDSDYDTSDTITE